MMGTNKTNPKVFISYSWPDEESEQGEKYRQFVIKLATDLRTNGVDAILDIWRFGGGDKNAFMIQMVTDPSIDNVLMLCDRRYKEKADGYVEGVGAEIQIIAQEVLSDVKQTKFIPVICESEPGKEPEDFLPKFMKSQYRFVLLPDEEYERKFELLLRRIYNAPFYPEPPLGERSVFSLNPFLQFYKNVKEPPLGERPKFSTSSELWETYEGLFNAPQRPNAMTLQELLGQFAEAARATTDKGTQFEKLIAKVLKTDPQYSARLSDVWLWNEWPDKWDTDVGIDLVAREASTGEYWAIQCKFFDPAHTLQKKDIDSFFTASGKRFSTKEGEYGFSQRAIVTTTDKWSSHAEDALKNQAIPVWKINYKDLADSPIDWSAFSLSNIDAIRLKEKKAPRAHQEIAIAAVKEGFEGADRGKLVMACGTGKTFTALRLMEETVPETGKVLFLAPSIFLIGQTLREWTAEAQEPFHAFAVCSDTKIGREEEDINAYDLAYPTTTDGGKLAKAFLALPSNRHTVVFSTYQSIDAVRAAQKAGLGAFDLIICDEAHRTTGLTRANEDASDFVKVHDAAAVRGAKRLYMTATPRIYADASKTKATEKFAALYSMDDEQTYGPEFFRFGFGEAVRLDQLSDYKVLIVAVREEEMAKLANNFNEREGLLDSKTAIDINFATKIIGAWKGLSKRDIKLVDGQGQTDYAEDTEPMRRAVAFSRSIKDSKAATEAFGKLVDFYRSHAEGGGMVRCELAHVDGTMNAQIRKGRLDWLKDDTEGACRILSNARCLSEGIDMPTLDAVLFLDTRESIVDIVQSVGRVMRKAPGKQYGYIILPVCIPSAHVDKYDAYIDSDARFKSIWKVVKALRAHDESLVDEAEFRKKIKVVAGQHGKGGKGDGTGGNGGNETRWLDLDLPMLPIDAIEEAVYAAIPKKLGDQEYWADWAKSIGEVAARLISRIETLIASNAVMGLEFDKFLKGLQDTLNPSIAHEDAVEMLAQHILTLPVFQALFTEADFPEKNAVGKALQSIVKKLDAAAVDAETKGLDEFYANVRDRIALAKSDKSKQDIIRNLYDTFFQNAFPKMAERLGIVYTPVEVVDFILQSVQQALQKHFKETLSSPGVQILDPFSGTGTFPVRLIQSGLIDQDKLPAKYAGELHANEIVLLAYYIASINIETAYHQATGEYRPFEGMVLTDTFQMTEEGDLVDKVVLPENNEKAERQLAQPIRVIVGNPPYSAQQKSEMDNNKNQEYPTLDARIRSSYAEKSNAKLVKNLYDSYIRAIRWASDRIKERGIVAFVTNGSFLNANNMDGLRKCLTEEFSHLYVFNLRGNQRTQGEVSNQEGGKIFGSGSRAPVALSIMVKDPNHTGACELNYYDIGDYLKRGEKLEKIEAFGGIGGIPWQRLTPNEEGDWINVRDPIFETFIAIGDKKDKEEKTIFDIYSLGVITGRDAWACNMSSEALKANMRRMIEVFNDNSALYSKHCEGMKKEQWPEVEDVIIADLRQIGWTFNLKGDIQKGKVYTFEENSLFQSMYRPFAKQWLYFNRRFNERVYQQPKLFPTPNHPNMVISCTGVADRKGFSALCANHVPNLHLTDTGQCFPLYWYEKPEPKAGKANDDLFSTASAQTDEYGYIRHDAITDWALTAFRKQYQDETITKEDIFWYVYGILHSPEYKTRFAANLKKMLPRIPFASDFWGFSKAGRALGELHLNYETISPWPSVVEEKKGFDIEPDSFYRVTKMAFGKKDGKPDKTVIAFNPNVTLREIPLRAYEYVVNGKSAIEWVMERYQVTIDKDCGIKNDPNDWSDNPRYILDLLKSIVTVSMESVRLVGGLPPLNQYNFFLTKQFEELAQLEEGWLDGEGVPPNREQLEVFANHMVDLYPDRLPFPYIFPKQDGSLLLEWDAVGDPSINVVLEIMQAYFHCFGEEDKDIEAEFNLSGPDDYEYLFDFLFKHIQLRSA